MEQPLPIKYTNKSHLVIYIVIKILKHLQHTQK